MPCKGGGPYLGAVVSILEGVKQGPGHFRLPHQKQQAHEIPVGIHTVVSLGNTLVKPGRLLVIPVEQGEPGFGIEASVASGFQLRADPEKKLGLLNGAPPVQGAAGPKGFVGELNPVVPVRGMKRRIAEIDVFGLLVSSLLLHTDPPIRNKASQVRGSCLDLGLVQLLRVGRVSESSRVFGQQMFIALRMPVEPVFESCRKTPSSISCPYPRKRNDRPVCHRFCARL